MKTDRPQPAGKTVWAFDLGKGSIGEAVRQGNQFLHKASLLIPPDFAETKPGATRRRMWRTRQAHKAREKWLDAVMRQAGIEVLHGRNHDQAGNWKPGEPADPRLEREFAKPGDPTCYTSCLLRIKLLRGERLEPWQVYKALHSAIQRRGYDPDIPWKTRSQRKAKSGDTEDDEAATQTRMEQFEKDLEAMAPAAEAYRFPCYFDAWKMGLWNPDKADELKARIDCRADTTRNQIVPRKLVEKELRALVAAAAKHYPELNGQTDYLLYGPAKVAYASFSAKLREQHGLKEGSESDWQGVMGQKIPKFENRILNDCALIPRLHVCGNPRREEFKKLAEDKLLPAQVAFLMQLKNMRVEEKSPRKQCGLTATQIKEIFEEYNPKRKYNLTSTQWKTWCEHFDVLPITDASEKGRSATDDEGRGKKKDEKDAVAAPTDGGRSRFSRPALRILKTLILSGCKPSVFHKKLVARDSDLLDQIGVDVLDQPPIKEKKDQANKAFQNFIKQPRPWLLVSDLTFLLAMRKTGAKDDSWEDLFIPNQRLDQVVQEISLAGQHGDAKAERRQRDRAIQELIGSQNDPKVRHRLATFWDRLQLLEEAHGMPKQVVLEFIREDFMGKKAKDKLKRFQDERTAARKEAKEFGGLKFGLYSRICG